MTDAILALNAGSSSIKYALFRLDGGSKPVAIRRGELEHLESASLQHEKLHRLLDSLNDELAGTSLAAVGHRIVHGGREFVDPVILTDDVMTALAALTPIAPLHQPRSLDPVRALTALRPSLLQVGCFDTAFHHNLQPPVSRYAIPRAYEAQGVRRYGFHGLSYEYIAQCLRDISPTLAHRKTVAAHLGNGASLCAMRDGQSVDTTMGFTALDGVVMGTRCGAIDPGILLYLQQAGGLDVSAVEDLLYRKSGLLGVSGISSDMRVLTTSADPRAAEAIALFTFSVSRAIALMANSLGGLECLVFTGGIGQHAAHVRARICRWIAWLGVALDEAANMRGADRISSAASQVEVRVIATDEEIVIARKVAALVQRVDRPVPSGSSVLNNS
jgi:acetate kinase